MMAKKKLLIYKNYVGTYRVHFFNDMNDAFETQVWLKKHDTQDQAFDQKVLFEKLHFQPHILPQGSIYHQLMAVSSQIREHKPNIVITTEYNLITIWVLLLRFLTHKDYKVVSMCDDSYNMIAGNDFTFLHRLARRCVSPFLDEIITVEPKVADWYQKRYHKGYFFPIIRDDKLTREDYVKSLSFKEKTLATYNLYNKHVILFVGRLVKLKNLDTLIKAYAKLDQTKYSLVIVGGGEEEEHLKQLAIDLGVEVLFTGPLYNEALNIWYNIAHTFVLPSYQEAFGAVTNEALIAGCYAVVSERAGSQCLIRNGFNGYVFNTMSVDDLAEKLEMSAVLPKPSVEANGLRDNMMIYDYSTMISQLIERIKLL